MSFARYLSKLAALLNSDGTVAPTTLSTGHPTWDSSGNLGVGTSSPQQKLSVSGGIQRNYVSGETSDVTGFIYKDTSGNSAAGMYFGNTFASNYGAYLTFKTTGTADSGGPTERMRLDSSGNLGLGVTPSALSASYKGFELAAAGYGIAAISAGGTNITANAVRGASWTYGTTGRALLYQQDVGNGNHAWYNAASSSGSITWTQAMTLDASGNLLGGGKTSASITTAGFELTSDGAFRSTRSSTSTNLATDNGGSLQLTNRSATDGNFSNIGGYNSNGLVVSQIDFINVSHASRTGAITFATHNGTTLTEAARIDSSGNLGLGVTPSAWGTTGTFFKALELAGAGVSVAGVSGRAYQIDIQSNAYYNGGWKFASAANYAAQYEQYNGNHTWFTSSAQSAASGSAITFNQVMGLDTNGKLFLGQTSGFGAVNVQGLPGSGYSFVSTNDATLNYSQIYFAATTSGAYTYIRADGRSTGYLSFGTNDSERMRIDNTGRVAIGTSSPSNARLTIQGSTTALASVVMDAGLASGVNGQIAFSSGYANRKGVVWMGDGSTGHTSYGIVHEGPALLFTTAAYNIGVSSDLTTGWTERMRLDSSGNLLVGATSIAGVGITMQPASGNMIQKYSGTGTNTMTEFKNNNGTIGYISGSGTTTSYVTSSDYRLKENVAPMTGALAAIAQLKPCTYTWKIDGSNGEGFIAHELAEVCPHAVTGEKDAVDEDGNPKYQGIDTSFLVATLTAAIQEQQAIIESLTARVAALEA